MKDNIDLAKELNASMLTGRQILITENDEYLREMTNLLAATTTVVLQDMGINLDEKQTETIYAWVVSGFYAGYCQGRMRATH